MDEKVDSLIILEGTCEESGILLVSSCDGRCVGREGGLVGDKVGFKVTGNCIGDTVLGIVDGATTIVAFMLLCKFADNKSGALLFFEGNVYLFGY